MSQSDNTCYGFLLVEQDECVTGQEGFYTMSSVWLAIGAVLFRYRSSTPKNGESSTSRRRRRM